MSEKIRNFKDLDIWKLAKEIVLDIYKETNNFPKTEVFALSSKIRRASISIPSNIAEGFNRYYNKEYKQFLYISLGSCAEIETQIEICYELKYISFNFYDMILEKTDHLSGMIRNLIKKL